MTRAIDYLIALFVTGAASWKFTVSDGTVERMVSMTVLPDPAWFDRIRAGWAQFARDLAAYVPVIEEPKPIGRAPEALPALRIEVTGMVTVTPAGTRMAPVAIGGRGSAIGSRCGCTAMSHDLRVLP